MGGLQTKLTKTKSTMNGVTCSFIDCDVRNSVKYALI